MSEVAAEHVEAVVWRRKKTTRPETDAAAEFKGVYRMPSGAYGAAFWDRSSRTQVWLGTFDTVQDASRAYSAARAYGPAAAAKVPRRSCATRKAASARGAKPESDTRTGFRGVYRVRSGAYRASIGDPSSRTQVWLGTFGTVEDAASAYAAAAVRLPGARKRFKFRGVSRTVSGKYGAVIKYSKGTGGRTQAWLGTFESAEEAARAYDAAAVKLHGGRALTNFGPGSSVAPGIWHGELSTAEWQQVHELLKDMDSTDDRDELIDAAAILHHIALAGRHGDGERGEPTPGTNLSKLMMNNCDS